MSPEDRIRRAIAHLTCVRHELMGRDEIPKEVLPVATKAGLIRWVLTRHLRNKGNIERLLDEGVEPLIVFDNKAGCFAVVECPECGNPARFQQVKNDEGGIVCDSCELKKLKQRVDTFKGGMNATIDHCGQGETQALLIDIMEQIP